MPFGFADLITDQHVFEYGRTGRSLNVAVSTGKPVLGMDAATGAVVTDYVHLRDVTGDTLGYVIDPTAYGSTDAYGGPNDSLRTANVAMHLLPPGSGFEFDDDDAERRTARSHPEAGPRRPDVPDLGDPAPRTAVPLGRDHRRAETGFVGDAFVGGRRWGARPASSCSPRATRRPATHRPTPRRSPRRSRRRVASVSWFALDSRTKNDDGDRGDQRRDRDHRDRPRPVARPRAARRLAGVDGRPRRVGEAASRSSRTTQRPRRQGRCSPPRPRRRTSSRARPRTPSWPTCPSRPGSGSSSGLAVEPRLLPDQLLAAAVPDQPVVERLVGRRRHRRRHGDPRRRQRPRRRSATAPSSSSTAVRRRGRSRRSTAPSVPRGSSSTRSRTATRSRPSPSRAVTRSGGGLSRASRRSRTTAAGGRALRAGRRGGPPTSRPGAR